MTITRHPESAWDAGDIKLTARTTAPPGWLLCDGAAVSRTIYAALFAAIATTYGAGDGSTTFNVPNTKGRVPVGRDAADADWDTLGEIRGAKTHALTIAELATHTHVQNSHNHPQNAHAHQQQIGNGAGATSSVQMQSNLAVPAGINNTANQTATNIAATATNQDTGSGTAHNNIQPSIVLNYVIKT